MLTIIGRIFLATLAIWFFGFIIWAVDNAPMIVLAVLTSGAAIYFLAVKKICH
jgi:hypothetical protein